MPTPIPISAADPAGEPVVETKRRLTRPTASIARSITWGFWWRKFLGALAADLFLAAMLCAIFVWQCLSSLPASATDGLSIYNFGLNVLHPNDWATTGHGTIFSTWVFSIIGGDNVTYTFPVEPFVLVVFPFLLFWLFCQAMSLLGFFSDTRRVRRKLQPLNDLAVLADTIGQAGVTDPMAGVGGATKMATLEQAISRASVDSPTITTGDRDLRSIEVALNGLLKQMQEAKLQQMRFVSDASHELRTPIAVIQGYVNMLDRWGSSDEEVLHESIEALKSESEHMQELVEQLLFLARGDSGRNTLQRESINLADIMLEVWDESCMIDESHVYQCSLTEQDAEDQRYQVTGDLAMVKQAVRIVVQNAQKYSRDGSAISLGVKDGPKGVSFTVQDEGIGMSEEDAAHIFERFYRANGAREESASGSGLGLSIAKWIIDAHGGTIEVLSREGVGTRFTITLPR